MSTIRLVSDLHIGNKGRADDFKQEDKFIEFLRDTISKGAFVYILGDLMELWQFNIYSVVDSYSELFSILSQCHHKIIAGNHDWELMSLSPFYGKRIAAYATHGDLLMIHGHIFDKYNSGGKLKGKLITKVGGYLERVYPSIDTTALRFRSYIPPLRSDVDYVDKCARLATELGKSRIAFGHTHEPGIQVYPGTAGEVAVINTGSWANGQSDYVEYDTEEGSVTLTNW